MSSKPVLTCFKYQVYLYGSEAITYLSGTEPALWEIRLTPIPRKRQKGSPPLPLHGSNTFTDLEENFRMVKLPYLCKKVTGKPVCLSTHHMYNNYPLAMCVK